MEKKLPSQEEINKLIAEAEGWADKFFVYQTMGDYINADRCAHYFEELIQEHPWLDDLLSNRPKNDGKQKP